MSETIKTARETILLGGLHNKDGGKEINHNLIQIDGVKDVSISLNEGAVTVAYDPTEINVDYLRHILDSLGYSPYVRY